MATHGASEKTLSKTSSQAGAYNQSRTKLYLRCRKAYWFRYDSHGKPGRELVPKHEALPLKRGTWMHALQQAHWAGESWEEKNEEMGEQFDRLFDEEKERYGDLPGEADRMFRAYLRRYEVEDRGRFRVVDLDDGSPAIEFVVEVSLDRWGIRSPFKGRIDLLVEDLEYGGYWIRDAKWVKSIPGPDERMMSPQNPLYVWAVRKALDIDCRGFIYDYGRTKVPTVPQPLKRGGISVAKKLDTDVHTFLQAVVREHGKNQSKLLIRTRYRDRLLEIRRSESSWFRRERIPVTLDRQRRALQEFIWSVKEIERRDPNKAPRTYLYNCKWNCAYHDPCVAEFQGLDIEPLLKKRYTLEQETYGQEETELAG